MVLDFPGKKTRTSTYTTNGVVFSDMAVIASKRPLIPKDETSPTPSQVLKQYCNKTKMEVPMTPAQSTIVHVDGGDPG